MLISFGKKIITPPVGTKVAGYGTNDVSVAKLDELYLSALCLDDGSSRVLIISYDLLGLDEKYIKRLRRQVAEILGASEAAVIISCTHTHSGPNSRTLERCPEILEKEYLEELLCWTAAAVRELLDKPFQDTEVYFYSQNCDQNVNRRYIGPENSCSFLPHRRDMERIADGICDKELGGLCFFDKTSHKPVYVIGNYAAHPLAGHCPGIGGHRISADYPGAFREYIEAEVGAGCMFISGAAGDMVPRGHETGVAAIRRVGQALAQAAIDSMVLARRDANSFKLKNESLQCGIRKVTVKVRPGHALQPDYTGRSTVDLEMQLVSLGDICLVGVPGELLAELGLEIKWHSPFRKTFILYCSTGYFNYLCHGNALVSGGYEGNQQALESRTGLKLVNAAVEEAYELRVRAFPDQPDYPDSAQSELVSLKNTMS
jgi:neutral ceramidase